MAGALGRVVSVGKGKVPEVEIIKQELKRSVTKLAEEFAAVTTTAAIVAATLSEAASTASRRRGRMREIKAPPQATKQLREPLAAMVPLQDTIDVVEATSSVLEILPLLTAAEIIPTPSVEPDSPPISKLRATSSGILLETSDDSTAESAPAPSPGPFPAEELSPSTDSGIADNIITTSTSSPMESMASEIDAEDESSIPGFLQSDLYPTEVDPPTESQLVTPLPEISAEPTTIAFENAIDDSATLIVTDTPFEASPPTTPQVFDFNSLDLPSPAVAVPSAAAEAFAKPTASSDDIVVVNDSPAEPEPAEPDLSQPILVAESTGIVVISELQDNRLGDARDLGLENRTELSQGEVILSEQVATILDDEVKHVVDQLPESPGESLLATEEDPLLNAEESAENGLYEKDLFEEPTSPEENTLEDGDVIDKVSLDVEESDYEADKDDQPVDQPVLDIQVEGGVAEVVEKEIPEQSDVVELPTSGGDEDIDLVLSNISQELPSVGNLDPIELEDSERDVDEKEQEDEEEAEAGRLRDEL